jgi:hypothetical protein
MAHYWDVLEKSLASEMYTCGRSQTKWYIGTYGSYKPPTSGIIPAQVADQNPGSHGFNCPLVI